jgi:Lhr-like helicase
MLKKIKCYHTKSDVNKNHILGMYTHTYIDIHNLYKIVSKSNVLINVYY